MPTPTYTALATVTLGSSASSLSFSSIPASYRDLVIVENVTTSTNSYLRIRFNGDSGNNYSRVSMAGDGSTATSSSNDAISNISTIRTQATSSNPATLIWQIMDYSATDKHKTVLLRANNTASFVEALAGRWANTAAINSIELISGTGTFNTGSTFNLFGIAS